jgi:ATPase subunit of ABC transporter with duplicated ATPase domains
VSAGKHRILQEQRLAAARQKLAGAEAAVRDDERIRIALPGTAVPAGRTLLEVDGLTIRGPERIALLGGNGSGKTTLLCRLVPELPTGFRPQRLDVLDDERNVLDNVRPAGGDAREVRAGLARCLARCLARFLVRGDAVDRPAGTLSGGDAVPRGARPAPAGRPPPQLLLLDEPTNNLDLAGVDRLTEALAAYRGALVVASHNLRLLRRIGIRRWWNVEGGVHETAKA